jgi:hypothetical protein
MALTRNRQGLLVVDLLVELDTSCPETTALAGLTMIVEKIA